MNRKQYISTFLSDLVRDEDIALFSTGYISREAYDVKHRNGNFYMIGSMGLLSSIGIGLAMASKKRVFVFDGDGSFFMGLDTMPLMQNCRNLIHVVLNNGQWSSTGGQTIPFSSNVVNCSKFYWQYFHFTDAQSLTNSTMLTSCEKGGPILVNCAVDDKSYDKNCKRFDIDPREHFETFRKFVIGE